MFRSFLIILVLFAVGCDKKQQAYQYTEVVIPSDQEQVQAPFMGQDPHEGMDMSAAPAMPTANDALKNKLTWVLPQGWKEEAGSAMRLATFHLVSAPKLIDVSIVSLAGGAGGLEMNLKRWMGQIKLDVPDEELGKFIDASKDDIFDFSVLQKNSAPSTPSVIAAMLQMDGATVFVKMTGSIAAVKEHKDAFLKLLRSVRLK